MQRAFPGRILWLRRNRRNELRAQQNPVLRGTGLASNLIFVKTCGLAALPDLRFGDLAGLDAGGADADALGVAVNQRLDGLQIDVPAAPRHVVRVRNVVTELRAFAANIAYLCHCFAPNFGVSCCRVRALRTLLESRSDWAFPWAYPSGEPSGCDETHVTASLPNLQYTRNRVF